MAKFTNMCIMVSKPYLIIKVKLQHKNPHNKLIIYKTTKNWTRNSNNFFNKILEIKKF